MQMSSSTQMIVGKKNPAQITDKLTHTTEYCVLKTKNGQSGSFSPFRPDCPFFCCMLGSNLGWVDVTGTPVNDVEALCV